MVLQPAKGVGVLKALGEVGFRSAAIAKINGIASAVFGIARWSRHLGAFLSCLVPFRSHIEENGFLKGKGAKPAEQSEINTISRGGSDHRVESIGCLQIQLNSRLEHDELIGLRFAVREVTQKPAIRIRTFTKA